MANSDYTNLKNYILRKLGSPVINIEISDDQLEDCIDEAIEDFHEEHFNGVYVKYLALTLEDGVTEYQLDDNIQEVLNILSSKNVSFNWRDDDPLLVSSFYVGNEHYQHTGSNLVDVEIFRQRFQMFSDYFEVPIQFNYNGITRKLHLFAEPSEDIDVFLKVYQSDDDDIQIYLTDGWVKSYSTALARKQWGINLMKYDGANLPGGANFNFQGILDLAEREIETLKEELMDKYSLPLDPQIG